MFGLFMGFVDSKKNRIPPALSFTEAGRKVVNSRRKGQREKMAKTGFSRGEKK